MAYADGDSLLVRIRLAFGANILADPSTWVWTDVTQYWHVPDEVTIGWGRSSGADQAETSTMSLTFKNTDSRFTAYDPRSPYWPHVKKWTPITYDIDLGDGVGWRNRYSGFVRKWPLTWPGRSPFMALAKIDCVGILGRLGRGKPAVKSPLRRAIMSPQHTGLLAYWPLEDEADSTQAASAIPGHPPLTAVGSIEFAKLDPNQSRGGTLRYGTKPLPDLSLGGGLTGGVVRPGNTSPVSWTVQFMAEASAVDGAPSTMAYWSWWAGGVRWDVGVYGPTTYDTTLIVGGSEVIRDGTAFNGAFEWRIEAWQNGPNINARLIIVAATQGDITPGGPAPWTASWPGTLGWPTDFSANLGAAVTGPAVHMTGHLQVWDGTGPQFWPDAVDPYGVAIDGAWFGHRSEPAHTRLARLCAEDGLSFVGLPVTEAFATRMGSEPDGTPLELYQECERTDQGLLYEAGFGLGFRAREARYNAPVAITIDAAAGQLGMPFEPVDDDQAGRNIWTVKRRGGSSGFAVDQDSIDEQGEIEGSAEINSHTDDVLADHAAWRLHLTTVPEPRYPSVGIDLGSHRELAAAWCDCLPGSRINVINPPEQNVPGVVDQIIVGGRETYRGRKSWKATLNVTPARPWQVAEVDGEQRVAADGSTLAATLPEGGMSFLLASTVENGVWTEDAADFPLDVRVGGELVRIASAGDATLNANPNFETAASDWTAFGGTAARSTAQAHEGVASLLLTPDGVSATTRAESGSQPGSAGSTYQFAVWVRCAVARTVAVSMNWFDSGDGYLSTTNGPTVAVAANTWTPMAMVATMPGGAVRVSANMLMFGTPAGSHLLYIDEARLSAVNVQRLNIAPGGRSIGRAWPAGTPVDVGHPAIAAL